VRLGKIMRAELLIKKVVNRLKRCRDTEKVIKDVLRVKMTYQTYLETLDGGLEIWIFIVEIWGLTLSK